MRLGLSSYSIAWAVGVPGHPPMHPITAVELIQLTSDLGVGLVQIADNLPLHTLTEPAIDQIVAAASARRIDVEVGTRGIGSQLSRYAELATRFGAPFVRVVIDDADDQPTPAEAAARLAPFEAQFRDRGLRLAIENHDRFRTDELAGLIHQLGDWTAICLDTVNSLGALEPPITVVERLGPLAINLHLKDFTIHRHRHGLGFEVEGTPAGAGLLDVPWLLATLSPYKQIRTAILELWTPPEPDLDATIAKEFRWVQESLNYLRAHTELCFDADPSR